MTEVILTINFTYGAAVAILAVIGLLVSYLLYRSFRYVSLPVQERLVSNNGNMYKVLMVKRGPFDDIYVLYSKDKAFDVLTEKEFLNLNSEG